MYEESSDEDDVAKVKLAPLYCVDPSGRVDPTTAGSRARCSTLLKL